jgi:hypothetical protein
MALSDATVAAAGCPVVTGGHLLGVQAWEVLQLVFTVCLLQVSTNDTAMALLPLLDRPPWVRRGRGGATEKFVGGSWQAVEARERHRLTQLDGQVRRGSQSGPPPWWGELHQPFCTAGGWLKHAPRRVLAFCTPLPWAGYTVSLQRVRQVLHTLPIVCAVHVQVWLLLHNLVADPAARSRMDMTEARANGLLRLKRHFNELLLDQVRKWGGGPSERRATATVLAEISSSCAFHGRLRNAEQQ